MSAPTTSTAEKRHPIQVVARRAGVTHHLLRAWERRYGVVQPARTEGGHRLYSDDDIERVRLFKAATDSGRRISNLAGLSTDEVARLVDEDRAAVAAVAREDGEPARLFVDEGFDAARVLDGPRLEGTLRRAALVLTPTALIDDVIAPLMVEVGEAWRAGRIDPAHEHMVTAIVRQTLATLTGTIRPPPGSPLIAVTTPSGHYHELGALLVAAAATAEEWSVLYLGSDLPAQDIARAVERSHPLALALSLIHPEADKHTVTQLRAIRESVGPEMPILVGGRAARSYEAVIAKIDAVLIADIQTFRDRLADLSRRVP